MVTNKAEGGSVSHIRGNAWAVTLQSRLEVGVGMRKPVRRLPRSPGCMWHLHLGGGEDRDGNKQPTGQHQVCRSTAQCGLREGLRTAPGTSVPFTKMRMGEERVKWTYDM